MRMIAGPNGSGKSTLIETLRHAIPFGIYINADEIELSLKKKPALHFDDFSIFVSQKRFQSFVGKKSTIGSADFKTEIFSAVNIHNNILTAQPAIINSYFASLVADFIKHELLKEYQNFSFETVMSHPSKIKMIESANKKNYRTYLYFISTDDPSINYGRIVGRVKKGGHKVSSEKIKERYQRSLKLLNKAISKSYRAYIFDNTVYGRI